MKAVIRSLSRAWSDYDCSVNMPAILRPHAKLAFVAGAAWAAANVRNDSERLVEECRKYLAVKQDGANG